MTPDDDAIEAIRARLRAEYLGCYNDAAIEDVADLLAALDERDRELAEARAEAQRERERAEAAEAHALADPDVRAGFVRKVRDTARREAIEEAIVVVATARAEHDGVDEPWALGARVVCGLLDERLRALLTREAPSTDEGTAGG